MISSFDITRRLESCGDGRHLELCITSLRFILLFTSKVCIEGMLSVYIQLSQKSKVFSYFIAGLRLCCDKIEEFNRDGVDFQEYANDAVKYAHQLAKYPGIDKEPEPAGEDVFEVEVEQDKSIFVVNLMEEDIEGKCDHFRKLRNDKQQFRSRCGSGH